MSDRTAQRASVTNEMVERAMRAVYDRWPTVRKVDGNRVPMTYEEAYGCAPLEHTDDAEEMRVALMAALDGGPDVG